MAKVIITHEDFVLEFENAKYGEIYQQAIANGIAEESLQFAWRFGEGTRQVEIEGGGARNVVWTAEKPGEVTIPLFFDNAVQDVWLEFGAGCSKIGEPRISNAPFGARMHHRRNSWYGPVEYGNEVGRSDFSFSYERGGVPKRYTVSYDVLSSKLDYHKDWKTLVTAVEDEYRMLSYDFLKKTYSSFVDNPEGDTSDRIWWEVFERQRKEFFEASRMILDRPKTRFRRMVEFRRADQIVHVPPEIENKIAEHRGEIARLYRIETDDVSRDTPENRFFKYAVESIAERHEVLARRVRSEAVRRGADAAFLKSIRDAEDELASLRSNPFFRGVGKWEGFKQVSLVLQQGLGYSDVLRIYGILEAMYSLSDGLYRLETKDIAQLYEIWCFIEVKNRVAAILGVPQKEVKHKNRGELGEMFGSEMRTGRRSRILIEKGDTHLELFYNPKTTEDGGSGIEETEAPTGGAQKPDIVLQLIRQFNGKDGFRLSYLFDAKYRIDGHRENVDTPPEGAINQMHRYRDAIYYKDAKEASPSLKKEVIGGYILFPGNGRSDDIEKAYFTRSIDTVNIGALPLRPGNAENGAMLQDFIQKLMEKSTHDTILSTITQKGTVNMVDNVSVQMSAIGIHIVHFTYQHRPKDSKTLENRIKDGGWCPCEAPVGFDGTKTRVLFVGSTLNGKMYRVKTEDADHFRANLNAKQIQELPEFRDLDFPEANYVIWKVEPMTNV
ncbi:MAG: DUF2357 domain-containing protein [Kiritimatiellae bacterium]|nr:DUF2357 domain-containing protein [Kiritimatiellia bacterium]